MRDNDGYETRLAASGPTVHGKIEVWINESHIVRALHKLSGNL